MGLFSGRRQGAKTKGVGRVVEALAEAEGGGMLDSSSAGGGGGTEAKVRAERTGRRRGAGRLRRMVQRRHFIATCAGGEGVALLP